MSARPNRLLLASTGAALVIMVATVLAVRDRQPVLRLEAGNHPPLVLDRPVTVRGEPGAVVEGGITIAADGVQVHDLTIVGGESGISVSGVDGVVIDDVVVSGAELHGIEVSDASARISDCRVSRLGHDYAQGIEVRNNNGRPHTHVRGCEIDGGREGIVTHVSRVEIRDNTITGTTNRALAITEMSEAIVTGNHVHDVAGVALFCGDMSRCDVRDNRVRSVAAHPGGPRGRSGQSAVVWYHSTARLAGNDTDGIVDVYMHSRTVDDSPLSLWPPGWRGAIPAVWITVLAIAALGGLRMLLGRPLTRIVPQLAGRSSSVGRWRLGRDLLITTAVAQVLHVGEHVVQVGQVFVSQAESRAGVAGARFDTEWLHFGFNAAVLAGLVTGAWLARHELARRFPVALAWLAAAALVQTWHVVEHVARMSQYLQQGISPAPGIIGDDLGLVWFHFGINIPVAAGLLVAVAHVARPALRPALRQALGRGSGESAPAVVT